MDNTHSNITPIRAFLSETRIKSLLCIVVIALLSIGKFFLYIEWDFDDSYIVYRIVDNLLAGNGWVYNVDEAHNASTSVLNTVLIFLLSTATQEIRLSAHIIGLMAIFGSGLLLFLILKDRFHHSLGLIAACIAITALSDNYTWGLETNLFICLTLLFVYAETRGVYSWPLIGAIVLARPDGLVFIGLKWIREFLKHRTFSVIGVLSVFAVILPWMLYSLAKFRQLFPDTLTQKIWQGKSGYWGTGPIYLKGLIDHYDMWILLSLAVIGAILIMRERNKLSYLLFFGVIQQSAYIVFNVPMYHWYTAFSDFLVIVFAFYTAGVVFVDIAAPYLKEKVNAWGRQLSSFGFHFVFISVIIYSFMVLKLGHTSPMRDQRDMAYTRIIGKIDASFGPGDLCTLEVGSIGYHTKRKILDIAGLTSYRGQFITPDRMDYFYRNAPEYILLHEPPWHHEKAIYNDYRFSIAFEAAMRFEDTHFPMVLYRREKDISKMTHAEIAALIDATTPGFIAEVGIPPEMKGASNGNMHLDTINGHLVKPAEQIIVDGPFIQMEGWAIHSGERKTPDELYISLIDARGRAYSIKAERKERRDVASHFSDDDLLMSGFTMRGATSSLPEGDYRIRIVQKDDGDNWFLDCSQRISIKRF